MPDETTIQDAVEITGAAEEGKPQAAGMSQFPADSINLMEQVMEWTEGFIDPINANETKLSAEEFLKRVGEVVVEDFQHDKASRAEWEENKAAELKLFLNHMDPKSWPWPGCSNVNVPFITVSTVQFQARSYDALIPPKKIVKAFDTGDDNEARAKRVAEYMNYDLLYKQEEFEDGMDKTLMQLPVMGSAFRKTYFDAVLQRNRTDYVSASDLVVNYNARYDEGTRMTHMLYMRQNDINKRVLADIFDKIGLTFKSANKTAEAQDDLHRLTKNVEGHERGQSERDDVRIVLEQHRGLDLDGNGVEEPVVVTVDLDTKTVLRISPRWEQHSDGSVREIEYFTHYRFMPNPEGYYGLGFGTLLRGLNEAANSILNEINDAGSLANTTTGFVSKMSGVSKGDLVVEQGKFTEINSYIDDIRKGLYILDFKGPNATLYSVLGLLFEYSKMVSAVSETMTGQLPASDTPATTVMALIEEGRKVYSNIHRRIHRAFKKELRKLYRLNSLYLDEEEYYKVLGPDKAPEGDRQAIGRSDFIDDIDVIPTSDPNITSSAEKIIKAQEVLQLISSSPLTANNPDALRIATKRYLDALDADDVDAMLAPPPPPPPPADVPALEENAMILSEAPVNVLEQQDHMQHLNIHQELIDGPFAEKVSPVGKRILEQHMKEHNAALYLALNGGVQDGNATQGFVA